MGEATAGEGAMVANHELLVTGSNACSFRPGVRFKVPMGRMSQHKAENTTIKLDNMIEGNFSTCVSKANNIIQDDIIRFFEQSPKSVKESDMLPCIS